MSRETEILAVVRLQTHASLQCLYGNKHYAIPTIALRTSVQYSIRHVMYKDYTSNYCWYKLYVVATTYTHTHQQDVAAMATNKSAVVVHPLVVRTSFHLVIRALTGKCQSLVIRSHQEISSQRTVKECTSVNYGVEILYM